MMVYDEALAERFRRAIGQTTDISEKRMMGGVCFFLNGNMIGAASRPKSGDGHFMVRVGKKNEAEALEGEGASIVEMGGRHMGGFIRVAETCEDGALKELAALALSYAATLPAKEVSK